MKRLCILLVLIPMISLSQTALTFPEKDGKVVYEGVVDVPGGNKNRLYTSGVKWFVDSFRDSKEVIQTSDQESGRIIGKGNFRKKITSGLVDQYLIAHLTIQLDFKNSRYRYRIYDISFTGDEHCTAEEKNKEARGEMKSRTMKKFIPKQIEAINKEILLLVNSIEASMNQQKDDF